MKRSGGGVLDTTFKFQTASSALNSPAPRPIRGSGLGAVMEKGWSAMVGEMPADPEEIDEGPLHAPSVISPMRESASRPLVACRGESVGFIFRWSL
jgi:hypothetical protein